MSTIPPPFDWSNRLTEPWHTDEGIERLHKLVRPFLPFDPYPFQLDCTARILDGQDVLCICETGGGKSALVFLPLLARRGSMSLMVCPTNFLESDMARGLERKGVSALVINGESLARASLEGRDLWVEARSGKYQVLICGPETTVESEDFDALINDPEIRARLGCFVIDEIHLIYIWGPNFRKHFLKLGELRTRLPDHTVLVGLTATLEPGREADAVIQSACFSRAYHFERRDCERRNIDIIFREIKYNCSGYEFRDLDWLVDSGLLKASDIAKCIIYCESIELGHRVTLYLRSLLPPHLRKDARKIIRHMHSVYCDECKAEGLDALYQSGEDRECGIFIATNVLSVGIDVDDIRRTIGYPCASSLSTLLQHSGRSARGAGLHGEAIVYVKKADIDEAINQIESPQYMEDPLRVPDLSEEPPAILETVHIVDSIAAADVDSNSALGQNVPAGPSRSLTANSIQTAALMSSTRTLPRCDYGKVFCTYP